MEEQLAHSPLGASGAERWINCHGSVALLKALAMPESDEPDWTKTGIGGHEGAARALVEGLEAWELTGKTFHDVLMTPELVTPIGVYLDYCHSILSTTQWIEYRISSPVHKDFYGTVDFASLTPGEDGRNLLNVVDLKFGEGILVEAHENPQLAYYAFGLIDSMERQRSYVFDDAMIVRITIVQPRILWADSPVRTWDTTVGEIKTFIHTVVVPAMVASEFDDALSAGKWCRFCPAKLVCPLMTAMFGAAAKANPKHAEQMTPERLGLEYEAMKAVKFYITALERQALATLMAGTQVPGIKLVRKKANRAWKPGAPELASARYGADAFTKPELKTPAALEAAVPAAKDWVKEWAFTPDTGFTVALASEPGVAQTAIPATERFAGATDA